MKRLGFNIFVVVLSTVTLTLAGCGETDKSFSNQETSANDFGSPEFDPQMVEGGFPVEHLAQQLRGGSDSAGPSFVTRTLGNGQVEVAFANRHVTSEDEIIAMVSAGQLQFMPIEDVLGSQNDDFSLRRVNGNRNRRGARNLNAEFSLASVQTMRRGGRGGRGGGMRGGGRRGGGMRGGGRRGGGMRGGGRRGGMRRGGGRGGVRRGGGRGGVRRGGGRGGVRRGGGRGGVRRGGGRGGVRRGGGRGGVRRGGGRGGVRRGGGRGGVRRGGGRGGVRRGGGRGGVRRGGGRGRVRGGRGRVRGGRGRVRGGRGRGWRGVRRRAWRRNYRRRFARRSRWYRSAYWWVPVGFYSTAAWVAPYWYDEPYYSYVNTCQTYVAYDDYCYEPYSVSLGVAWSWRFSCNYDDAFYQVYF